MLRIRGVEEVTVEIITLNPIMIGHCEHCEILMKGFGIDYKLSSAINLLLCSHSSSSSITSLTTLLASPKL